MWKYDTSVVWHKNKTGDLRAAGNEKVEVATPPDFGGPSGKWSPEQLLTGAVGSCLMTTALYYLDRYGVDLQSYVNKTVGTMDKTPDGLAFTRVDVDIELTVTNDGDVEKARKALHSAEKHCPISAALLCPVQVDATVNRD